MLAKLLAQALTRPDLLRSFLHSELERLKEGGYLDPEELERLGEQGRRAIEEHLGIGGRRRTEADAADSDGSDPGAEGGGWAEAVRQALDLPSRSHVDELRERVAALEARLAALEGAGESPPASPPAAPPAGD